MSVITIKQGSDVYTSVDKAIVILHSEYIKDIINMFPKLDTVEVPTSIPSISNFIKFVMSDTYLPSEVNDEFKVHKYLQCKEYFLSLITHIVIKKELDQISMLDEDLKWEYITIYL